MVIKGRSGHKSEKGFRSYVKVGISFKDQKIRTSFSRKNILRVVKLS
jgi:hypothetical protein